MLYVTLLVWTVDTLGEIDTILELPLVRRVESRVTPVLNPAIRSLEAV